MCKIVLYPDIVHWNVSRSCSVFQITLILFDPKLIWQLEVFYSVSLSG